MVQTNAVDDRDDEFNKWYDEVHLRDVLGVDGFIGAQRFEFAESMSGEVKHRYLAIYEIETDDLSATIQKLGAGSSSMVLSDAMASDPVAVAYRAIGERLES